MKNIVYRWLLIGFLNIYVKDVSFDFEVEILFLYNFEMVFYLQYFVLQVIIG